MKARNSTPIPEGRRNGNAARCNESPLRVLFQPRNSPNQTSQNDVSLSLPQVLSLAECPEIDMVSDLAQTPRDREQFSALLHLWIALGRPSSGFWRETRVYVCLLYTSPSPRDRQKS